MIPQRNLSLLSNRLAAEGGRRITEAVLERDYCLSWFLVALSRTPLVERLAFKGGTALKKCYFPAYRFSEDLDFTLLGDMSFADLQAAMDLAFLTARHLAGMPLGFDREDRRPHQNSHTFYLRFEGPLPIRHPRTVKVDVTRREDVVYPLMDRSVLRGYDGYEDLPADARLRVYSLEEVAAEKTVSILDRARNEPRDLYDLAFLIDGHVELAAVRPAIERKLEFRGRRLEELAGTLAGKEARYRQLWNTRLAHQMALLPDFERTFRTVRRAFRRAEIR